MRSRNIRSRSPKRNVKSNRKNSIKRRNSIKNNKSRRNSKKRKRKRNKKQIGGTNKLEIIIDNIKFTILYKIKPTKTWGGWGSEINNPRSFIVLQSDDKVNTIKFVIYSSLSELYTWRFYTHTESNPLHICKSLDYITSTFIHIKLQKFINDNYDIITPPSYLDEDDKTNASSFSEYICSKEELKPKKPGKRCDEICHDYLEPFKPFQKIYNESCICGEWHFLKEGSQEYEVFNVELDTIISKLKEDTTLRLTLDIATMTSTINKTFPIIRNYLYYLCVINSYIKENFSIKDENELYTYNKTLPDRNEVTITILEYTLTFKDTLLVYNYYVMKYTISKNPTSFIGDSHEIIEIIPEKLKDFQGKEYKIPLFIIPKTSMITSLGIYDCFIYNFNLICKPFHYVYQFGTEDIHRKKIQFELPPNRIGLYKNQYFFIGDLIDTYINFHNEP